MSGIEREEYARQLHNRLVQLDPVAPAEFANEFLDELVRRLRAKVGFTSQDAALQDAATDALLDYVQHPSKFKPGKSALLTYLTMAAYRDFVNLMAKEQRRQRREVPIESVEETLIDGNNTIELENNLLNDMTETMKTEIVKRADQAFPDPTDRALLELMIDGERKTASFCKILGIDSMAPNEQRKTVKQHKDRIIKRLQRIRTKLHEK